MLHKLHLTLTWTAAIVVLCLSYHGCNAYVLRVGRECGKAADAYQVPVHCHGTVVYPTGWTKGLR